MCARVWNPNQQLVPAPLTYGNSRAQERRRQDYSRLLAFGNLRSSLSIFSLFKWLSYIHCITMSRFASMISLSYSCFSDNKTIAMFIIEWILFKWTQNSDAGTRIFRHHFYLQKHNHFQIEFGRRQIIADIYSETILCKLVLSIISF